jgi:hypothetical protein
MWLAQTFNEITAKKPKCCQSQKKELRNSYFGKKEQNKELFKELREKRNSLVKKEKRRNKIRKERRNKIRNSPKTHLWESTTKSSRLSPLAWRWRQCKQANNRSSSSSSSTLPLPFPDIYNAASRRGLFARTVHGHTQINSQRRRPVEGQLIDIHPPPLSTKSLSYAIANFTLFIRPRHLLPSHNWTTGDSSPPCHNGSICPHHCRPSTHNNQPRRD